MSDSHASDRGDEVRVAADLCRDVSETAGQELFLEGGGGSGGD